MKEGRWADDGSMGKRANAAYFAEEFLEKILFLKEAGYQPGVLFVTWPPLLGRLPALKKFFRDQDLPFSLMIFQGSWEGKQYPEAYTPAERTLLGGLTSGEDENKYRLLRGKTRGKLCHAGRVYANVKGNGDVFRCGVDAFGRRPRGNIFDPDFRLHEEAMPCPYEKCSCQEFEYLDELRSDPGGSA